MLTAEDQVPEHSFSGIVLAAQHENIFKHLRSFVLFFTHGHSINLYLSPELNKQNITYVT